MSLTIYSILNFRAANVNFFQKKDNFKFPTFAYCKMNGSFNFGGNYEFKLFLEKKITVNMPTLLELLQFT